MKTKNCCDKGCLEHKYHCGICNAPLTYSPQNFCSRPEDIPNPCPYCHNQPPQEPSDKQEKWVEEFERKFEYANENPALIGKGDAINFIRQQKEISYKEGLNKKLEYDKEGWEEEIERAVKEGQQKEIVLTNYWINKYKGVIEKKVKEIEKDDFKKHICRFNDGKCDCDCYLSGINRALKILKNNN